MEDEAWPEDWPKHEEDPPTETEDEDGESLSIDSEKAERLDRTMINSMCKYLVKTADPGVDAQYFQDRPRWGAGYFRNFTYLDTFQDVLAEEAAEDSGSVAAPAKDTSRVVKSSSGAHAT